VTGSHTARAPARGAGHPRAFIVLWKSVAHVAASRATRTYGKPPFAVHRCVAGAKLFSFDPRNPKHRLLLGHVVIDSSGVIRSGFSKVQGLECCPI
jgi:hypothetical protein